MSAALGGDDLIRFQQGKNGARILQAELFGLDVNRTVQRNMCGLIFRNIRLT